MSAKIIPLISSGVAGPLGVIHLPRMWQKTSLEMQGMLADGYPHLQDEGGYDGMTLTGLGITADEMKSFIKDKKPTYPQFEAWVCEKTGLKPGDPKIEKLNAAVLGYNHDDDTRKQILSENGLPDGDNAPKDAVNLNNLDDWLGFHTVHLK